MIYVIHERLLRWISWARSGLGLRIGYPVRSLTCRDYVAQYPGDSDSGCHESASDDEALETEAAVLRLGRTHRQTIVAMYVWRGGIEGKARRLHVSVSTLYRDRDAAHRMLDDILTARMYSTA